MAPLARTGRFFLCDTIFTNPTTTKQFRSVIVIASPLTWDRRSGFPLLSDFWPKRKAQHGKSTNRGLYVSRNSRPRDDAGCRANSQHASTFTTWQWCRAVNKHAELQDLLEGEEATRPLRQPQPGRSTIGWRYGFPRKHKPVKERGERYSPNALSKRSASLTPAF